MKNYEIMLEISDKESEILENMLNDTEMENNDDCVSMKSETDVNYKNIEDEKIAERQKKLALTKIHEEMSALENTDIDERSAYTSGKKSHTLRKRTVLALVAVFVLLIGNVVFAAAENDWDIRFAEKLNLDGAMQYLDGGYVKIGEKCIEDGISITAAQAIGDKNSQWIELDTDVKWTVPEDGCYMFGNINLEVTKSESRPMTGGYVTYSYNNNGYVSFVIYTQNFRDINRSVIKLDLDELYSYDSFDSEDELEDKKLLSDASWHLQWENHYAANTITRHPVKLLTADMTDGTEVKCILTKVELSPVSVRIEAWKSPYERGKTNNYAGTQLDVDSVILKDGTEISFEDWNVCGENNNMHLDTFVSMEYYGAIDPEQVEYVVVEGAKLKI